MVKIERATDTANGNVTSQKVYNLNQTMESDSEDVLDRFHREHRITDRRVVDFYARNKSLRFEDVNSFVVDLFEKVWPKAEVSEADLKRDMRLERETLVESMKAYFNGANSEQRERFERSTAAFFDKMAVLIPKVAEEATAKMARTDVLAVMQANHEFTNAKLSAVTEEQVRCRMTGERMSAELQELQEMSKKDKDGSSQFKGGRSEALLEETLNHLFPTANIVKTAGFTGAGDFRMERSADLPPIMFENKFYAENVKWVEVEKFRRDAKALKMSAVMLSQKSGIVGKADFEIEVDSGNVLVYLHSVEAASSKILSAVAIIDAFVAKLKAVDASAETEGGFYLSKEDLEAVFKENEQFDRKVKELADDMRQSQKRHLSMINDMHQETVVRICKGAFVSAHDGAYPCTKCTATFRTKASLGKHLRTHNEDTEAAPKKKTVKPD